MIVVLFRKTGVFRVKAKMKTIEFILISLVIILDAYLININIKSDNYKSYDSSKSSANYVEIENVEVEVEPIVFDGKTLRELSEKIDKSLNSTISGKGELSEAQSRD